MVQLTSLRSDSATLFMTDWVDYNEAFVNLAMGADFDEAYVKLCLSYGNYLVSKGLPIIFDREHFSKLVGYDPQYLIAAYYSTEKFYRRYEVTKVSGGMRQIAEPLPSLKEVQRWILDNILYHCEVSKFSKGFVPKLSIRDNARFHRNQTNVLSLDIKDFFPSVNAGRVFNFFQRLGYQRKVVHLLTKLCTLDGSLPQGAPTSPALSNLVSIRIDRRLSGFALKENIRYTRYADDLTFSGNFESGKIIKFTRKVLADDGYELNEAKTRLMERHQRQEVTGIVVNQFLQAPRKVRRKFRQTMHFIEKFGIESHIAHERIDKANYLKHLLGIGNFILFVNPKDEEVAHHLEKLHQILQQQGPQG